MIWTFENVGILKLLARYLRLRGLKRIQLIGDDKQMVLRRFVLHSIIGFESIQNKPLLNTLHFPYTRGPLMIKLTQLYF